MLEKIGYDPDEMAPKAARWPAAVDVTIGRVLRVERATAGVLTESGPLRVSFGGALLHDMAHDEAAAPCAGDWCEVRCWPDHRATIERVLPRRTVMGPATGGRSSGQALCANFDHVAVVVAGSPAPSPDLLGRLVSLARQSGAQPVVVLTRTELVADPDLVLECAEESVPGVPVVRVSARTGRGIAQLLELVDGRRTLALVGPRGHGRTSLTNRLVGAEVLAAGPSRVGGHRDHRERRRHTSVHHGLVALPDGGAVIDTLCLDGVEPTG